MKPETINLAISIISGVGALMVATAITCWFVFDQLRRNRKVFWDGLTALHNTFTVSLDNHIREDRSSFKEVNDAIFDIRLRNARVDGLPRPERAVASDS